MGTDAALELVKLLAPAGTLAVVAGILAFRSPQLVRELFAGVDGLLLTLQKIRHPESERKPLSRSVRRLNSKRTVKS
jgi:hypothetical protein